MYGYHAQKILIKREETAWGVEKENDTKAIKDELTLTGITPTDIENQDGITKDTLNEIVEQVKNEINSVKINGVILYRKI